MFVKLDTDIDMPSSVSTAFNANVILFLGWDRDTLITYIGSKIPEASREKLVACSDTIYMTLSELATYPIPPVNDLALNFHGFVRAVAFLSGKTDQIYHTANKQTSGWWAAQLSRQPDDIISDTIFAVSQRSKR
jgi:hypothetical protein